MRYRVLPAATLAVCSLCAETALSNVIVDGDLGDWGISFTNDLANYGDMSGHGSATVNGRSFQYHEEDQSDSAGFGGYLGPNHGGQNYDAEFLGAGVDGAKFVIAILTGQRPDNAFDQFSPGDVRIRTAAQEWFGIEIGGGAGGDPSTGGRMTEGAAGATYDVDARGLTRGVALHEPPDSDQVAGSVWGSPTDWVTDPIIDSGPSINPQLTSGRYVGLADYIYGWDAGGNHAVIEIAIDRSLFGGAAITEVEWAPGCGNDILHVDLEPQKIPRAPEPASVVLLLLGICGILLGQGRTIKSHLGFGTSGGS